MTTITRIPTTQIYYNSKSEEQRTTTTKSNDNKQNTDNYTSKNPKRNLKNALKNGDVKYTAPTKILCFTIRDGFYTYIANGHESAKDIKDKFGIPDGILRKMNYIFDDEYVPKRGTTVCFNYITK